MQNKQTRIIGLSIALIITALIFIFQWTAGRSQPTTFDENSKDIPQAKLADYKNCVILRKENATLVLNKVETGMNYPTIPNDLAAKLAGVGNLNIIYGNETDYKDVVDVLDAIAIAKVKSYRLLKM